MIVLDIVNQFLEKIAAIVDLEKTVLSMRVDTCDLGVTVSDASWLMLATIIVVLRVEHVFNWHLLLKLKHFDDVGLCSFAWTPLLDLMLMIVLVAEKVVLSLIRIDLIFVPLFLVPAGNTILVDSLYLLLA